jgi:hypothetical protein
MHLRTLREFIAYLAQRFWLTSRMVSCVRMMCILALGRLVLEGLLIGIFVSSLVLLALER